jgi:hypothetical protein
MRRKSLAIIAISLLIGTTFAYVNVGSDEKKKEETKEELTIRLLRKIIVQNDDIVESTDAVNKHIALIYKSELTKNDAIKLNAENLEKIYDKLEAIEKKLE